VPLAGVPVKAGPEYLRRLVSHGYRVAVCEQVEDPKVAKGIVRREVVETISPGVAFADDLLDGSRNNFVVALSTAVGGLVGIAAADISTGEFRLKFTALTELDATLARFSPREMLVPRGMTTLPRTSTLDGVLVTEREPWEFDEDMAREDLARQFGVRDLEGLGLAPDDGPALGSAGALLRYLKEMQPAGVPQLARPTIERAAA
jgi:Mismatch repair ATPase (MutS family)